LAAPLREAADESRDIMSRFRTCIPEPLIRISRLKPAKIVPKRGDKTLENVEAVVCGQKSKPGTMTQLREPADGQAGTAREALPPLLSSRA